MIGTILSFLPLLGAAAIMVLAQTQIKERSEQAALALTIGAGLEVAYLLGRQFYGGELLWFAAPLVHVGAAGGVAYGLITLIEAVNPRRPAPLPAALATLKDPEVSIALRVIFGVFALMGVFATGRYNLLGSAAALVAIAGALAGTVWVERQGPLARWILERRPELVVWSYVHQLKVVNRQTGSTTVHWSAQLGLASGARIPLPALGEQHAQTLVAGVMERCPGVVLGFSPENAARFKASPEAMRGGAPSIR